MFTLRRKRKLNNMVFFLLFASFLIGMPLLIAFSLGSTNTPDDLRLGAQPDALTAPLLAFATNEFISIDILFPVHELDSWRIKEDKLELTLHSAAVGSITPEQGWLDQQVQYRLDNGVMIIEFELDNLPPIFRVAKMTNGYRIIWSEAELTGKRIAIDPGHGGHDPGAIGYHIGLFEKDVTLAIALELENLLLQSGAEVFLTRTTDTLVDTSLEPGKHIRPDLWKRRDIVAEWDPDFFISIHNNSWVNRNTGGIETYFNPTSLNAPHSKRAAQLVQDRLVAEIARKDRGLRYKESSDAVLQTDNYPSILAEILFISNKVEEGILADPGFAKRAAQAIYLGIADYYNGGGIR